jgi:hypothetical protein
VRAVEQPLADVQASLTALRQVTADVRSPWLLGRIQTELDELDAEFADNQPRLDNAVEAVRLAPQLLGGDGTRRYLVMFTSPVEARGLTGFFGNYAVVEIADGRLDVTEFGRRSDLEQYVRDNGAVCDGCPPEMMANYGRFGLDVGDGSFASRGWSAITLPAHFPHVGEATAVLAPQNGIGSIDGVIAMDPYVVQALMRYTGPVELAEAGVTVEPDNAAEFLLEGQYQLLDDSGQTDNDERIDAIDTLGQQVIRELLGGALPVPSTLARDLGPLVGEQRLVMWAADPDEQAFLDRIDMSGALPSLGDDGGFGVMVSNAGNSKIDAFLDRTVDVTIETADDGTRTLVADVTLANDAPASGLPRYVIGNSYGFEPGTSWLWVNFLGPDTLLTATRDGEPVELDATSEAGWTLHHTYALIPAGESLTYRLEFALGPDTDGVEQPVLWEQPLARRLP